MSEASTGRVILAGDVGGSKCELGLFEVTPGGSKASSSEGDALGLRSIRVARLPSRDADTFEAIVTRFLGANPPPIELTCVGVAGPVQDGTARGVNLPWVVDAAALGREIGCERVHLLNDLEATAYGTLYQPESALHTLHEGIPKDGNRGVIAAGTGLGQAFLFWDGQRYVPAATEGGHVDFAPRDELEFGLLQYLKARYQRVSYERVLSGPGLFNVFSFLRDECGRKVDPRVAERIELEDPNAVVGEAGVSGQCATCEEAVERFVSFYGTQAGNLALTVMATGGIYVGGGIVTKILTKMTSGRFLESFRDKGRYVSFMNDIPVHILLDPGTSLIGAAQMGRRLLGS